MAALEGRDQGDLTASQSYQQDPGEGTTQVNPSDMVNETAGEDLMELDSEIIGAEETESPTGFLKFAKHVSEDAMNRSTVQESDGAFGTKSKDGTLWVEGKWFACKEAYELWIMASIREDMVVQAMATHIQGRDQAEAWKKKLRPCPQERVETEGLQLQTFEQWWGSQDGCDQPGPLESDALEEAVSASGSAEVQQQQTRMVNRVAHRNPKDPNVLEVNTADTHTVLITVGTIGGRTVRILNDSGADASVMSDKCAGRLKLKVSRGKDLPTLRNPNGDGLNCVGVVETTVLMADQHLYLKAYVVSDITIELLVGGDFLRMHEAVLSYADLSVSYHGVKAEMYQEPTAEQKAYVRSDQAAVVITEDVTLRSDRVVIIEATALMETSGIRSAKAWEFIPLEGLAIESGVIIPHSIVTVDKDLMIPVKARLSTGPDLVLAKGTVLGTLKTLNARDVRPISRADYVADTPVRQDQVAPKEADEEKFKAFLERTLARLPPEVDAAMKADLVRVLTKHKATLCAKTLGETMVTTFDMVLNPGGPVQHKDRRWSHEELMVMKEQIDTLRKMGMIEPSDSDWASRLVMVTKKDGSIRVCVDFREVNKLTKRDAYPAPQIEQTLDQLREAKYYTSLDAEKGYYQVRMSDRAKLIAAFRSPFGLFQFTRMPFGLTNAPAVFQRMMDKVLHGLAWNCCMVYLDDVIIYSKTWSEHIEHLDLVR